MTACCTVCDDEAPLNTDCICDDCSEALDAMRQPTTTNPGATR